MLLRSSTQLGLINWVGCLALSVFRFGDVAVFCYHTDVMTEGVKKTLAELEDPEFRKLAASLPEKVMLSRAHSTAQKYRQAFQYWQASS